MRLFVTLSAAIMLTALAFTACNSSDGSGTSGARSSARTSTASSTTTAASQTPNDGVERITTSELRDALEKGTAVVIDVRSAESYKSGHIRGALNIPEPEIAKRKEELPRDKKIVLYCS